MFTPTPHPQSGLYDTEPYGNPTETPQWKRGRGRGAGTYTRFLYVTLRGAGGRSRAEAAGGKAVDVKRVGPQ